MAGANIRNIRETDAQLLAALRHIAPWVVVLFVMPLGIFAFRRMWAGSVWLILAVVLLAVASAGLTWLVEKQTHNRSRLGRGMAVGYTSASMTFFTAAVALGMPNIPKDPMFILWVIGGLGSCIAWNIYYRKRGEQEVVIDLPKRKPAVTTGVIQGELVGAEMHPDIAKALEKVNAKNAKQAILAAKAQDEAARVNAAKVITGFQQLTAQGKRLAHLADVKLKVLDSGDYCTDVLMTFNDNSTPDDVTGQPGVKVRQVLATRYRVGVPDVRIVAPPRDNSRATMRVVWIDPLDETRWWKGPQAVGKSFGEVPITIGTREDMKPMVMLLPHSDKYGKVSSHVLVEGMNGSGKSNTAQTVIADGSTRPDVVFWAIDVAKGLQTLGDVAPALDWFVTDKAQARLMMKALVEFIIPGRGTELARHGLNNWTPEAWSKYGIPYLVVIVEEGAIIFEALGKRFVEVMMLARSVGIAIWGSIQRAQHDVIDTNARAQFSEVLCFGMQKDDDVFGLPEDILDMGASPAQWRNRKQGMCYYSTALVEDHELAMPNRTFRNEEKMLREVTGQYGPNMARLERSLIDNANRLDECYDERETGNDVVRRLMGAGAVALDAPRETQQPEAPVERESTTLSVPPQRRTRPHEMPERPVGQPVDNGDDDLGDDEDLNDGDFEEVDDFDDEGEAPGESKVIFMPGKNGRPDLLVIGNKEVELDDLSEDLNDMSPDDFYDPDIPVPDETDDMRSVEGSADDDEAATTKPQHPDEVLVFEEEDDEEVAANSDSKEGAHLRLLKVLAGFGVGHAFRTADLYDEPELPYVNRSKSWLRTEVIALAKEGLYVVVIDDPTSPDDGKYVTTEYITRIRPALLPVS